MATANPLFSFVILLCFLILIELIVILHKSNYQSLSCCIRKMILIRSKLIKKGLLLKYRFYALMTP